MASATTNDKVAYNIKPKVKATLELDGRIANSLFRAVKTKYSPPIAEGSFLLCALKSIDYIENSYLLNGQYVTVVNNKSQIIESKQWLNDQPIVWIIEILLLEYNVGDQVLLLPRPSKYINSFDPMFLDPVPATITETIMHSTIGDLSYEYVCNVGENAQGIHGGAVYGGELGPRTFESSKYDTFDTSIPGLLEFEAIRAIVCNIVFFGSLHFFFFVFFCACCLCWFVCVFDRSITS